MTRPSIPVVSYADLIGPPAGRQRAIATLGQALEDIGFFILEPHPVSPEVVRRAYQVAAEFFALSDAAKAQYSLSQQQGGFSIFGSEQAKGHSIPDLKEFWHVNRHSLRDDSGAPWPQEVPSFRPVMTRLYQQLMACAEVLLAACSDYLGQPSNWLVAMATEGDTVLRLAHYPAIGQTAPGSLRAAPHEDINLITLLCEATAPGLEILTQDGQWLPVKTTPGQIVVDTGDMLQNLTNGLFKSTTHRVVNPQSSNQSRLSMPFFVHPRPEIDLTPVNSLVDRTGGVIQFPPITAAAYLAQRLGEIQVEPVG
ncbi:2-oxoglutarate and iron-dependent oxygenase domain-containing protein [Leptolyngbya sp. CCNP1308]|uniref:isopenicillin N synthase family dioxygenase n=1 Tax=Leptolyngbya sp. CCNP1308 TaxID=3110255 RepID=UPI002B1F3315|nr:2-oxoglutarate and iron-dependent oxygenase domain-containing protein [Leptolyngbya sp. CCNP1308]MEA5452251.1 2-oxoglutarate and iron-dependent oxygenase domain-containing protein [Leptolyngbya sp. CCNP1308]